MDFVINKINAMLIKIAFEYKVDAMRVANSANSFMSMFAQQTSVTAIAALVIAYVQALTMAIVIKNLMTFTSKVMA